MDAETMALEAGKKLKRARENAGWSQKDTDNAAKVTFGRTYSYERGRARPPEDFIEPLAKAWDIPMEWFYDGIDDQPPKRGPKATVDARDTLVPVMGDLPSQEGRIPLASDPIPAKTLFPVPEGSGFWRIRDNNLRGLKRGDYVLIFPDVSIRRDTLCLLRTANGTIDLYNVVRENGQDVAKRLGEDQEDPGTNWQTMGYAPKVRRTMGGGLIVSIECETGLSLEMLSI